MNQQQCKSELEEKNIVPKKYYGQVFTSDEKVIDELIETIKSIYKPGTKIVEIGGGLGYITERLAKEFDDIDVLEIDDELYKILNNKFVQQSNIHLIKEDILEYDIPKKPYLLVGNIPFHISGKLYRKFMSEIENKPYGMVFITDKQYATTLMGQPPRCYRVSLQAQSYGDIEIISDVPPTSVYPEPKVMSCIMKITHNPIPLPDNFWDTVNYHFENFPTKEVESPKTVGLEGWINLCKKQ
ncbi:hypothetical protein JW758_02270 [Candidatus Peregrinibacteria bacterium]|nr:hypothetical protein [Candidatus Peregrinibacteria bacterium]